MQTCLDLPSIFFHSLINFCRPKPDFFIMEMYITKNYEDVNLCLFVFTCVHPCIIVTVSSKFHKTMFLLLE